MNEAGAIEENVDRADLGCEGADADCGLRHLDEMPQHLKAPR